MPQLPNYVVEVTQHASFSPSLGTSSPQLFLRRLCVISNLQWKLCVLCLCCVIPSLHRDATRWVRLSLRGVAVQLAFVKAKA
jgi:hypothetical protein